MLERPEVFVELLQRAQQPEKLIWEPLRPGIGFHALYGSPGKGPSAALLHYDAGAAVPFHLHTDYEHILVLRGSQRDERGLYEAGTLLVSSPGSGHTVVSDDGCLVLAVWAGPIEFR